MITNKNILIDLTLPDGGTQAIGDLDSAYDYCRIITTSHYENFPVASVLIPKKFRKYIYAVYAFSRIADDIADELEGDNSQRIKALDTYLSLLTYDFSKSKKINPIFLALQDTMSARNISAEPFNRLITAFKSDINFIQPETWDDVKIYCNNSANPVGEIILRIFGNNNDQTILYSDNICTGLQLANFWQDLSIDLRKERYYLPKFLLEKHKLDKENLFDVQNSANLVDCLDDIYKYTSDYFEKGSNLVPLLNDFRLRLEILLTLEGGKKILNKTKKLGYSIINIRPKITKTDIISLVFTSLFRYRVFK